MKNIHLDCIALVALSTCIFSCAQDAKVSNSLPNSEVNTAQSSETQIVNEEKDSKAGTGSTEVKTEACGNGTFLALTSEPGAEAPEGFNLAQGSESQGGFLSVATAPGAPTDIHGVYAKALSQEPLFLDQPDSKGADDALADVRSSAATEKPKFLAAVGTNVELQSPCM